MTKYIVKAKIGMEQETFFQKNEQNSISKGGGFFMKNQTGSTDSPLPERSQGRIKKSSKEKCYGTDQRTGRTN